MYNKVVGSNPFEASCECHHDTYFQTRIDKLDSFFASLISSIGLIVVVISSYINDSFTWSVYVMPNLTWLGVRKH